MNIYNRFIINIITIKTINTIDYLSKISEKVEENYYFANLDSNLHNLKLGSSKIKEEKIIYVYYIIFIN
jgi:hypothetical protein